MKKIWFIIGFALFLSSCQPERKTCEVVDVIYNSGFGSISPHYQIECSDGIILRSKSYKPKIGEKITYRFEGGYYYRKYEKPEFKKKN